MHVALSRALATPDMHMHRLFASHGFAAGGEVGHLMRDCPLPNQKAIGGDGEEEGMEDMQVPRDS